MEQIIITILTCPYLPIKNPPLIRRGDGSVLTPGVIANKLTQNKVPAWHLINIRNFNDDTANDLRRGCISKHAPVWI